MVKNALFKKSNFAVNQFALAALERLEQAGYPAYLVGGCLRDQLLGLQPQDWDIATAATPEQVQELFADKQVILTGLKHGTVTVLFGEMAKAVPDERVTPIEVTTFRREGSYLDNRHPSEVAFVSSLEEDLARRDFTLNALAYAPSTGLVDPFGGAADLAAGTLRAVGDPHQRLREDALRIIRALRFAATLGLEIEPSLKAALHQERDLLQRISAERVRDELLKLLLGRDVVRVLLEFADVLAVPIPEIAATVGFNQHNRHHIYDVWEHSLRAISAAVPDTTVRLTLLFHDLGKPATFFIDEGGQGHFYGHEKLGAELARPRLQALRYSRQTIERVTQLIDYHSTSIAPERLPRLLNKLGEEALRQLLEVRRGDQLAHRPKNLDVWLTEIDQAKQVLQQYLEAQPCYTLANLAVNGDDLQALGYLPGRQLGQTLNCLLDQVLDGRLSNQRDVLLKAASGLGAQDSVGHSDRL